MFLQGESKKQPFQLLLIFQQLMQIVERNFTQLLNMILRDYFDRVR